MALPTTLAMNAFPSFFDTPQVKKIPPRAKDVFPMSTPHRFARTVFLTQTPLLAIRMAARKASNNFIELEQSHARARTPRHQPFLAPALSVGSCAQLATVKASPHRETEILARPYTPWST